MALSPKKQKSLQGGNMSEQHTKPSTIVFQCTREQKGNYVSCAYPGKLTDWIVKTLDKQAKKELESKTAS